MEKIRERKPKDLSCKDMPNRVRELRLAKNLTIPALARICNISSQRLHRLEKLGIGGKDTVYPVATALGVDPRDLEKTLTILSTQA